MQIKHVRNPFSKTETALASVSAEETSLSKFDALPTL
jgi:hypothetical protein